MLTVDEGMSLFPGPADIRHFHTHGYVVSPPILDPDLIAEAAFGAERYYAGERDWPLPIAGGFLDWRPEHGEGLRINDYVSLQSREFQSLVGTPALGRAFSLLAGGGAMRLFHDQLIGKPPGLGAASAVGWHVDAAYWRSCASPTLLTAWIPLGPYEADMGPLAVFPGSHRWPGHDWMTTFNERDLRCLEERIHSPMGTPEPKMILIGPGQVSFHHARTIHGSLPNQGRRTRLALTVHAQSADNAYQLRTDCRGRVAMHVNDALCRRTAGGDPDYSDPDICPLLWPCGAAAEGGA
jgi:hypothetical protein